MGKKRKQYAKKMKKHKKEIEKLRLKYGENPCIFTPLKQEEMDRYVKCISECGMPMSEIEGDKCLSNDFAKDTSDSFSYSSTPSKNNKNYYRKEKSWNYWE